jgi:hypothetical protein
MDRIVTLLAAGMVALAVGVSCDDDTSGGDGGTTTSSSSTSGATGGGGSGGDGGTTSSSSSSSSGGGGGSSSSSSGSQPPCGSTVQGGDVCPQLNASCVKTDGCCQCLELVGCNPDPIWACLTPANDPGCVTNPPSHAETCGTEGLVCQYCTPTGVEIWRCHNLAWLAQMPGCGD